MLTLILNPSYFQGQSLTNVLPMEGLVPVKGFGGVGAVGSPLANADGFPPPPAIPISANSYP